MTRDQLVANARDAVKALAVKESPEDNAADGGEMVAEMSQLIIEAVVDSVLKSQAA